MRHRSRGALAVLLFLWGCSASSDAPPAASAGEEEAAPRTVETVGVGRRDFSRSITLPGSVVAFEQAVLYARVSGYLSRIHVDKGDRVRKGQVLAELEIPEMAKENEEVAARVLEAGADFEVKRITFERLSTVREKEPDVLSQQEVDQARYEMEKARAAREVARAAKAKIDTLLEYANIRAPFSGVVTDRFVDPGALIETSGKTPVVTVMNMSTVRVYVQIPETEVAFVREGTAAALEADARHERFEGSVTRVSSALDPSTRTMKVEIDFENLEGKLLHGMYGKVALVLEERRSALALPADAVLEEGDESYVFCVDGGAIVKRSVGIGLDDARLVQITSGLSGDERVVVGDRAGLREGMKVAARPLPAESH
jgi:RND family efflux transporter MFP subunit